MRAIKLFCCCQVFTLIHTAAFSFQIDFVQSDFALDSIIRLPEHQWMEYEDQINNGLDNGLYWIRFSMESSLNEPYIIGITNAHVNDAVMYFDRKVIPRLDNTRFLFFELDSVLQNSVYYLRVNCDKEANIPLVAMTASEYEASENSRHLIFAAYYGFILAVILFNLNFCIHYKDSTYAYYIMLMLAVNIPPAIKEGIFHLFLPATLTVDYLEPLSHILCGIAAALFTYRYLDLTRVRRPFFATISILMIISIVLLVLYLVVREFILYAALDVTILVVLTVCVGFGMFQFKQSPYARFFTLAYFPLLIAAYDTYICTPLGISFLQLTPDQYRIGTAIELLVFTVAIGYKGKIVAKENQHMRLQLKEYTEALKKQDHGINERPATVADLIEHFGLTIREIDVLKSIAMDRTYREIADQLFVSENTIKFHARNIFAKLKVSSRQAASQKYLHFPH